MKALGREALRYADLKKRLGAGHVSTVGMKRSQMGFLGKEFTHKLLGFKELGRWST